MPRLSENSRFKMQRPDADRGASYAEDQIAGKGAFGIVVMGMDKETRRTVAIKFLTNSEDEAARQRFIRERNQLKRVTESGGHPAIASWLATEVSEDGVDLLVMDYVHGLTLLEWLRKLQSHLDWKQALSLLLPLASALAKLHDLKIGHRDISPNNILVPHELELSDLSVPWSAAPTLGDSPQNVTIKIVDFGLAKPLETGSTEDGAHSETVGTIGTQGYLAPEHRMIQRDDRPSAFSADVYSFGAILFKCLTGKHPTHPELKPARRRHFLRRARPPYTYEDILRESHPRIPAALVVLIDRCLERTPCRRPTAKELVRDLEMLLTTADGNYRLPRTPLLRSATAIVEEEPKRLIAVYSFLVVVLLVAIAGGGWRLATQEAPEVDTKELQRVEAIASEAQLSEERATHKQSVMEAQKLRQAGSVPQLRLSLSKIAPRRRSLDDALVAQSDVWTSQRVLALHDGPLTGLLVDRKNGRVVSTGLDGRLLVTRLSDGVEEKILAPGVWSEEERRSKLVVEYPKEDRPFEIYLDLRWTSTGEQFAGITSSGRIDVWSLSQGKLVEQISTELPVNVFEARPNSEMCLLGCDDGRMVLWSRVSGLKSSLQADSAVTDIVVTPEGTWIVSTAFGELLLLDSDASQIIVRLKVAETIWDLGLSEDSGTLAAVTNRAGPLIIKVAGRSFGTPVELPAIEDAVTDQSPAIHAVQFATGGRQLWAGASNRTVRAWDVVESRLIPDRTVHSSQNSILGNDFDPFPFRLRRVFSAIEPGADDAQVLLGGRNGGVIEMTWNGGPKTLDTTPGSKLSFSSTDPDLLLEAAPNGDINVWRVKSGMRVSTHAGWHPTGVCSISWEQSGDVLLTASSDGAIRFARIHEDRLVDLNNTYKHVMPIKVAALSPDGQRFAVVDMAGTISVLSRQGFQLLGKHDESPEFSAHTSDLVFDRAGDQLLAFGAPGRSLLLSGHDGTLKSYAERLAVVPGTAVVRDPDLDGRFLAADQSGRINRFPFDPNQGSFTFEDDPPTIGVGIVGADSNGNLFRRRYVACSSTGTVRFFVPDGGFSSFSVMSPIASQNNRATGMLLSCDGHTLSVAHADGRVTIWHEQPAPPVASTGATALPLTPDVSHIFTQAVELNPKSVVSLDDGSVMLLLFGKTESMTDRELILAKWHPELRKRQTRTIRRIPVSDNEQGVNHSMALTRIGDRLYGCVRMQTQGYGARCFLFHVPIAQLGEIQSTLIVEEIVGEEDNAYLMQSLFEHNGRPAFTHFKYAGMKLLFTQETDSGWVTSQLGRQGDGMHQHAISVGGRVVAVGRLNRANSDVGQWYSILQSRDQSMPDRRIPVDSLCIGFPRLIKYTNDRPGLVYSRVSDHGTDIFVAPIESERVPGPPKSVGAFEGRETFVLQVLPCKQHHMAILTETKDNEFSELTLFNGTAGNWTRTSLGLVDSTDFGENSYTLIEHHNGELALIFTRTLSENRTEISMKSVKAASK